MIEIPLDQVICRRAKLAEILDLRYAVLCAGQPVTEAQFTGDTDAQTRHFGAFLPGADEDELIDRTICCVSYMRADRDRRKAWQLRGMATDPKLIGRGIGKKLVEVAQQAIIDEFKPTLFWCRARVPSIGFYEKLGWEVASDEYEVGVYGPHRDMVLEL